MKSPSRRRQIRATEHAQKAQTQTTEPLVGAPDDIVAHAHEIANREL